MSSKQLIKIIWRDEKPYLLINDIAKQEFETIPFPTNFNIKKLPKKYCIGSYPLDKMAEQPCRQSIELTDQKSSACSACNNITGFSACVMCHGHDCRATNQSALEFCKKECVLYIAYFPGDKIKVGTAVSERRFLRLLDQGAIYSYFIARADGRKIREIEDVISNMGLTQQVPGSYKIKNIIDTNKSDDIKKLLMSEINKIRRNLRPEILSYFVEPEFNSFEHLLTPLSALPRHTPPTDLFGNVIADKSGSFMPYTIVTNTDAISGKLLTVIGTILIYENGSNFYAFNLKDYFGWLIEL